MAALALAIPLARLLAAGKVSGWRAAAWSADLAAAVLGLALILLARSPSGLGAAWVRWPWPRRVLVAMAKAEARRQTTMDA